MDAHRVDPLFLPHFDRHGVDEGGISLKLRLALLNHTCARTFLVKIVNTRGGAPTLKRLTL